MKNKILMLLILLSVSLIISCDSGVDYLECSLDCSVEDYECNDDCERYCQNDWVECLDDCDYGEVKQHLFCKFPATIIQSPC